MRMPDTDGRAFYLALRAMRSELAERVMFLTGDTLNPDIALFLEKTGCPCLEKPILPKDLLDQVKTYVARRSL
jgi:two-component system NtrC family sensor kinase